MAEEKNVELQRVFLTQEIRDNDMYPKFLEISEEDEEYALCLTPADLPATDGAVVFEPKYYIPHIFNRRFVATTENKTLLFFVEDLDLDGTTWGSRRARFGTPLTYG